MFKPETTDYATTAGVESNSDARPLSSSKLQRLIKLILFDPYRSSTPDGIALLIFGLKLVLILPFVNVPSVLRIQHQLGLAWNPSAAEALSTAWNYLLVVYLAINLVGVAFTSVAKGSRNLIAFLLGTSIVIESSLSFFHSFLFDAGASLATALGPFSMAIVTYRLLLGYRFGLFQSVLTMGLAVTLYLGLTVGGWPSAPILATQQLSPTFSIFELNFLIGWYLWVALGSNFLANYIQGLRVELEEAHRELQSLNQYVTESVLKRYLPPTLIEEILEGRLSMDKDAEARNITVMFTDLKGFTQTSEALGPERIAALLNQYLTEMNAIIFRHGGTIDKFIGDAIMVMFGAPAELSAEEQANRAVRCALEMQERMPAIAQNWKDSGAQELAMRIGIHQGVAVVGNFGSNERSDYTCIGPTVNLASRIETVCAPGEVFVSPAVQDKLSVVMACHSAGKFELKGIDTPIELFSIRKPS